MKSSISSNQQQTNGHMTTKNYTDQDLNLSDVIEVIRHSDPAIFQEFQSQFSAISSGGQKSLQSEVSSTSAIEMLNQQKKQAYVKITEQPASKGLRFRYECEGRSAGSIPGCNSTNDNKTYPSIQIVGYQGRAVVVVSCVSCDPPYRPHPHNLVGKEGCKKGVCTLEIPPETMTLSFQSLGIQCVKRKEIEEALFLRQQIRVDPFQTGFAHRDNPQGLDLNCVRLCFQVFLEGNEKGAFTFALKPVVSDPIFDKKAKNDLTIYRMADCSASVAGGKEMLLFCDKVIKDDIQVRFAEENKSGQVIWEGFGDFQPSDVHKQYGIAFRTPRYKDIEIEQPVTVKVQLRRPSDGALSEPRKFDFLPLDSGRGFWTAKRLKTNYNMFNSILTVDQTLRSDLLLQDEPLKRKTRTVPLQSVPMPMSNVNNNANAQQNSSLLLTPPTPPTRSFVTPTLPNSTIVSSDALSLPSKSPTLNFRPLSQASECSNSSVATKQSVNDILSIAAESEDMSVYSMDLNDALGGDMSFQNLMKLDSDGLPITSLSPVNHENVSSSNELSSTKNPSSMGSMTSVSTVKEMNKPFGGVSTVVKQPEQQQPKEAMMDLDVDVLYDDVMQCVYDDVDVKYDKAEFADVPPPPPTRKVDMSLDYSQAKPLPETPSKLPTIIATMIGKKPIDSEATMKKKEMEEQKRKEKEEKEKQKAKEKEERQKLKSKPKASKAEQHQQQGKSSLFQRVFHRSKSQSELSVLEQQKQADENTNNDSNANVVDTLPVVPAHNTKEESLQNNNKALGISLDAINGNENVEPTEADLSDLKTFLDSENLDHLDNMLTEFAKQYLPTDSEGNKQNTIQETM